MYVVGTYGISQLQESFRCLDGKEETKFKPQCNLIDFSQEIWISFGTVPQPQVFLIIIHGAVVIIVLIGFEFSCIHSLISFSLRVLLSTFSSSERARPVVLTITDSKLFLPGGSLLWIVYLLDFVETFRNKFSCDNLPDEPISMSNFSLSERLNIR